jgi:pyruvate dehydrogenase E2 component (dihydrolipoamide acetyltransferase)
MKIVLPALMPGMEEGLLARWCVKPGDVVAAGDVLAEVETDKATIELPATIAGVIEEIHVPEGTAGVRVNTPLARMRDAAADEATSDAGRSAETNGPVSGTDDPAAAASEALHALGIGPGSYDLVPLEGLRRTIATRMTSAFRDIPHFALSAHLQVDELLALRSRLNAGGDGQDAKITVNDMLLKAAATALMRVPAANASYTPFAIARHRHADIAFAVADDELLVTPIVRAADQKPLREIARETRELAELARGRRLQPAQYQGGSFTLSNLGMFGVHSFDSILNPPHGCILSVGAIEQRVVVSGGGPLVASMVTVTLTCDHRVVDGIVGARWLAALRGIVEAPSQLVT